MEQDQSEKPISKNESKKAWKWLRPSQCKIADKVTKQRILNPPPQRPEPEFKGVEYITGVKNESNILYQCGEPNCAAKFTTERGLNTHVVKHLNRKIQCKFCTLNFKTEDDLTYHLAVFHPDLDKNPDANPLQCQKCGRVTRDVKALWRHVRETHRDRIFPCTFCGFQFNRPESLKEHLSIKHPENGVPIKYPCRLCGKEFIYKNSLNTHIRLHHRGIPQKSYRCVLCKTSYFQRQTYNRHMNTHANPTYFPCHVCNVRFRTTSHLRRHQESRRHALMLKKTKSKKDVFTVPIIKTVTTAKNPNLTKEELMELCKKTVVKIILHKVDSTHNASQPGARKGKQKSFQIKVPTPTTVKKGRGRPRKNAIKPAPTRVDAETHHSKTRVQPSPRTPSIAESDASNQYLNCVYCDKVLPNLDAVKLHETLCFFKLKNRKVFVCPVCDKEFDFSYKFKVHCKTHSTERPYKCTYCDATFKINPTRVQHEKAVHFGIRYKPKEPRVYKCNHVGCEKQYKTRKSLRRHVSGAHLGIRYPCEICGRQYKREEQCRKHMKVDHAECPIRLECKPCNRTYKDKYSYMAHLQRGRHSRKSKENKRQESRRRKFQDNMRKESLESEAIADVPEEKMKTEDVAAIQLELNTGSQSVENTFT